MEKSNYGWICPRCGTPNSPLNKTCVACMESKVEAVGKMLPEDQLKRKDDSSPTLLTED